MREKFVRIIHTSKSLESMGKHIIVQITMAGIKVNVRIVHGSHYPGSNVIIYCVTTLSDVLK